MSVTGRIRRPIALGWSHDNAPVVSPRWHFPTEYGLRLERFRQFERKY